MANEHKTRILKSTWKVQNSTTFPSNSSLEMDWWSLFQFRTGRYFWSESPACLHCCAFVCNGRQQIPKTTWKDPLSWPSVHKEVQKWWDHFAAHALGRTLILVFIHRFSFLRQTEQYFGSSFPIWEKLQVIEYQSLYSQGGKPGISVYLTKICIFFSWYEGRVINSRSGISRANRCWN